MICPPVREIIHSLKIVNYLPVQADKLSVPVTYSGSTRADLLRKRCPLSFRIFCVTFYTVLVILCLIQYKI